MNKLLYLKYNKKLNWTGLDYISVNNLFLELNWNNLDIIKNISSTINELSSLRYNLLSGIISDFIVNSFKDQFPNYISSINNVTGFYQNNISGFSTLKLNNILLSNTEDNIFLSSSLNNVNIINSFNNLTGDLNCISSITINEHLYIADSFYKTNLGYYLDYDETLIVISVNGHGGNVNVLTSIIIEPDIHFSTINNNYLVLDIKNNSFYKRNLSLVSAVIPSSTNSNAIINLEMFNKIYKTSAEIKANVELLLLDVIDWICITTNNYKPILPISASLENNTLRITTNQNGIIYFYKIKN